MLAITSILRKTYTILIYRIVRTCIRNGKVSYPIRVAADAHGAHFGLRTSVQYASAAPRRTTPQILSVLYQYMYPIFEGRQSK